MEPGNAETGPEPAYAPREWPLRIFKRVFGFTKVCYRGLKKNHEWLCAAFALAYIYKHRRQLIKINLRLAPLGVVCPPEDTRDLRQQCKQHNRLRKRQFQADKTLSRATAPL